MTRIDKRESYSLNTRTVPAADRKPQIRRDNPDEIDTRSLRLYSEIDQVSDGGEFKVEVSRSPYTAMAVF